MNPEQKDHYDVVVIGGAFSGALSATLLRRFLPSSRVLVVESLEQFDHKVGEATVEISALTLSRVLGMHDWMARNQLPKHGLRYWFTDHTERTLGEMSEVGPREVPRLPAFQLDRALMDEALLAQAQQEGAELMRPAKVTSFELGWPESRLTVENGEGQRTVTTRWVIDASGRHAVIARRLNLLKKTMEHPTSAYWGRWSGVADLDGVELMGKDPRLPQLQAIPASRRLATNHFCGHGWWCWVIPLSNGETSIGLVFDKRMFEWPTAGTSLERYKAFMAGRPGLRELTAHATLDEEDFRSYAHLPYSSSKFMEKGWSLVGDAAAFLDPYYSPGLDFASISSFATAHTIEKDLQGKLDEAGLTAEVADHNDRFTRSYQRWLNGLYLDKYEIMGDVELTGASFMLDTAMYYMGVVTPIYEDLDNLRHPLFGQGIWQTRWAFNVMRFYNQRLVKLARQRRQLGIYGRWNVGRRMLIRTASLGISGGMDMFKQGAKVWLRAEASTFWARVKQGKLWLPSQLPAEAKAPS